MILVLIFVFSTYSLSFAEELILSGEGAILIDFDTLEVLYAKNAHSTFFPASTTKIMTAIIAIEQGNLQDIVTIDQEVVDLTDGSHIALEPGEELTLEQLLNALLIGSSNDAALAIAKHISGSIEVFVNLMNDKAKSIGALNTNFVNPNGLPNDLHISTPYDLALMGKYAMEKEIFRDIVQNYTYTIPITNRKAEARYLKSANRLLFSTQKINVNGNAVPIKYEGINGVKSGYTVAAQNCMVTSLEKNGHKFIAVVLKSNGTEIYSDIHKLLDYGLSNYENVQIGFASKFIENVQIENGILPFVAGITKSDSHFILHNDQKSMVKEKVLIEEPLEAPISTNQVIGKVEYWLEDRIIAETDIISTTDVEIIPVPSLYKKLLDKWYLFVFLILIIGRIIILRNRKKRFSRRRAPLYRI